MSVGQAMSVVAITKHPHVQNVLKEMDAIGAMENVSGIRVPNLVSHYEIKVKYVNDFLV